MSDITQRERELLNELADLRRRIARLETKEYGTATNTDDLPEGVTNLYYTAERTRDDVGTALVAGAGITITPNDGADTITLASTITQYTDEMAQDAIGAAVTGNTETGIAVTYDDVGNKLNFDAQTAGDARYARLAAANTFTEAQTVQKNQNTSTTVLVENTDTGASAQAGFEVRTHGAAAASFAKASAAYAGYKITASGDFYVYNAGRGDIAFLNDFATGRIKFAAGGHSTPDVAVEANGNLTVGPTVAAGKVHIDQASTTATIPVLVLDQADVSEPMIEFETTVGTGNTIEAKGAKVLTTTHFLKVKLPDNSIAYIEMGTIA